MNSNSMIFAQIAEKITALPRPAVIGIDGAYTSGKTTLTDKLADYLKDQGQKVQIIHYDDFHQPLPTIQWSDEEDSEVNAFYNAFNAQKLVAEILLPLKERGLLHQRILGLDWSTAEYRKPIDIAIDNQTILLLEGALLLRTPIRNYLDYAIFLEVSVEEILLRGEARDVPKAGKQIMEKYRTRYLPVFKKYLATDQPKAIANMVIDNNDYHKPVIIKSR